MFSDPRVCGTAEDRSGVGPSETASVISRLSESWVLRSAVVIFCLGVLALVLWIAGEGRE